MTGVSCTFDPEKSASLCTLCSTSFLLLTDMSLLRLAIRQATRPLYIISRPNSTASSSTPLGSAPPNPAPPRTPFPKLHFDIPDPPGSSTAWWERESKSRSGQPGTVNSGRTYPVMRGNDFAAQYKKLQIMLSRTGIKSEMKRKEFYESPSEKRVRLGSERHRRRFAARVSGLGASGSVDLKADEVNFIR